MKTINIILKITLALAVCSALILACSKTDGGGSGSESGGGGGSEGKGGSMARFAIKGDMLYTVAADTLKLFDISNPVNPKYSELRDTHVDNNIETIFPMDTLLYIGSQSGMFVYDITEPGFPKKISQVSHIRSCDPVVVEGHYAYITLNTNYSVCGASPNNVLKIYNVTNPIRPIEIETIDLNGPQGLGADGNLLFVCDKGLKVFNIATPNKPETIRQIADLAYIDEAEHIRNAYDVIPANGTLILVAAEGLFLFDYSQFEIEKQLTFLSKIETSTKQ